jgi:hypothetical protein
MVRWWVLVHCGPQKELAKYDYSPVPCFFFFSFDIKILLQFNKKHYQN